MADDFDQYLLKKKQILNSLDVHPTESAIILNYTVQSMRLGEDGQPVVADKKPMQKTIRVRPDATADLYSLASEIVSKCSLIPPTKTQEVEQLLYYIQKRTQRASMTKPGGLKLSGDNPEFGSIDASMDKVENYIELLYEDIPEKVKATKKILELAKEAQNLDYLLRNEALISALSRVLREDSRKSMELSINIITVFYCFSNFPQYHAVITQNKVGDMCFKITDNEMKRSDVWKSDMAKLSGKELDAEQKKYYSMMKKQDQLLFVCFHLLYNLAEDLSIEIKMVKRDIVKYLVSLLDRRSLDLRLLIVTFLKKLSIFKENKTQLLVLSDNLISKVTKVITSGDHPALANVSLRLLYNLSFDDQFRGTLIKHNFVPKLIELLSAKTKHNVPIILHLLYLLSADESAKQAFASTDILGMVTRMILESQAEYVNPEVMALAINLATQQEYAEKIVSSGGLKFFVKRALKTKDTLLLKMIRNVAGACSGNSTLQIAFLEYIDDFMHSLLETNNPEVQVEILGMIAALQIPDFDWAKLAETYDLFSWITRRIQVNIQQSRTDDGPTRFAGQQDFVGLTEDDDIILELVILIGNMAMDDGCIPLFLKHGILNQLMDILVTKEEDDEIILQTVFAFYQLLLHEPTRNLLVNKTDVVGYFIDLLYDKNVEIRKSCDACLDIVAEISEEWRTQIQAAKFKWHNAEWVHAIESGPNGGVMVR